MSDGWKKVTGKILRGFLLVAATLTVAAFAAPFVSALLALSTEQIGWFRLFALGMVAWGVLGRSGFEIQSYKGGTPHEKFNSRWFLALYVLGLFCGALGVLVKPAI